MKSIWGRAFQYILIAAAILYAGDWAVFGLRLTRHTAYGSVSVSQYLSTPLKGNKAEYDYLGSTDQRCTHSIFSHGGDLPCWWLERHKNQWQ